MIVVFGLIWKGEQVGDILFQCYLALWKNKEGKLGIFFIPSKQERTSSDRKLFEQMLFMAEEFHSVLKLKREK